MKYKYLMAIAIFGLLLLSQSALKALDDTLWCHYTYPTSIYAVKFMPDGKYLATGGSDGVVTIWNALTGDSIKTYKNNGYVSSLDISPDGKYLAMCNNNSSTNIYNLQTDSLVASVFGYKAKFTSDGSYLITSAGIINKYETQTWSLLKSVTTKHGDLPHSLDVSADNQYIVTGSQADIYVDTTGYAELYNFSDLSWKTTLASGKNFKFNSVCFSPDSKYVAIACDTGSANIYTTSNIKLYKTFSHYSEVDAIAFSPDGNYLIEGGGYFKDLTLKIWDINLNSLKYTYPIYTIFKAGGALNISVNNEKTLIGVGGGAGVYMLNANWNPVSVSDDIITITNNTIYPNPTSSVANIEFTLLKPNQISINIYDNNSNLVNTIYNGLLTSGTQNFKWDASGVINGIYFCNISINNQISTIKIIVSK